MIKTSEKVSPVAGESEPSDRGLWRIEDRGPWTSRSRSAKKSRENPPTARHHPASVSQSEFVAPIPAAKAEAPVIIATMAVRFKRSNQKKAAGLENTIIQWHKIFPTLKRPKSISHPRNLVEFFDN